MKQKRPNRAAIRLVLEGFDEENQGEEVGRGESYAKRLVQRKAEATLGQSEVRTPPQSSTSSALFECVLVFCFLKRSYSVG